MTAPWFRVAGTSVSGGAARTPNEASDSFDRAAIRAGWYEHELGSAAAACSARLYAATTRRAAQDADVSAAHGTCGRGEWWIATGEDFPLDDDDYLED